MAVTSRSAGLADLGPSPGRRVTPGATATDGHFAAALVDSTVAIVTDAGYRAARSDFAVLVALLTYGQRINGWLTTTAGPPPPEPVLGQARSWSTSTASRGGTPTP